MDVAVSDPPFLIPRVFEHWVGGIGAEDCAQRRYQEFAWHHGLHEAAAAPPQSASLQLLRSDTLDQYRMFEMLQPYLLRPDELRSQMLFQLPRILQLWLLERYYALDDGVLALVLERGKLSRRARRDVEDIAQSTGVPLRSCLRQFDNLARIAAAVEEVQYPAATLLERQYRLPPELATRYACVVYLLGHRMQLKNISLAKACDVALLMLGLWSAAAPSDPSARELEDWLQDAGPSAAAPPRRAMERRIRHVWTMDLHKRFAGNLRDLRALIAGDALDARCAAVHRAAPRALRNLLTIGSNLGSSREFRDLFEDLQARVGDLLGAEALPALAAIGRAVAAAPAVAKSADIQRDWLCFIVAVREFFR